MHIAVVGFIVLATATLGKAQISNCPAHLPRTYHLYQFEGSCYTINAGKNTHQDWSDATVDCAENGGLLADIHSQAEQDFILSSWKAIRNPIEDGKMVWMALSKPEGKWSWYPGRTELDFHNWAPSQPANASHGNEKPCGLMELSGEWYEYPCKDLNGWICEFSTISNFDCPANLPKTYNLLQWRDHCYLFSIVVLYDWQHADSACRIKGGDLVDIHSHEEQDFIFSAWGKLRFKTPDDKGPWIGLTDGQNYYQEGQWNWTSNEKQLDYQNWSPGQPQSPGDLEDCALMVWDDYGKWHDYPCSQSHGSICKFRRGT